MSWPELIPGAVMAGSFRLGRVLDGSSGRVHEARHDRMSGRFAVKLFPGAEPGAFQHHARLALALRHPGVAQVIDYGVDAQSGQAFVAMELVPGQPLAALVRSSGLVPPERVAALIGGVAAALRAAHDHGIVHGHLDPDRILVGPGDETKVVGLGLPEALSDGLELSEVTPYTAPEQIEADGDARSDQFALGAIAYEMLTGVPPFDDSTERQEPPSIRDYAPDVNVIADDVIRRALAPEPDDRWSDVTTFADRLREATGGGADDRTRIAAIPIPDWGEPPTPVDAFPAATPAPLTPVDIDLDDPLAASPPPARTTGRALAPLPAPGAARLFDPRTAPAPVFVPVAGPESDAWASTEPTMQAVRGRGAGRALALVVTAGLIAVAGVKLDVWHHARTLLGTPHPAATPPPAAAPTPPPPPVPGPPPAAGAPPGAEEETADTEGTPSPALRPEVVPIPAAPAAPAPPVPAPPMRRHHRHRRAAALPPDLAAEEALLSGDTDTKPAKHTSRR